MMSDKLTDAELVQRLKLSKSSSSQAEAAQTAGCSTRSFRESIAEAKARGLTATTPIVDEASKLKAKVKLLEAELATVEKANLTAEKIRETIYGLSVLPVECPSWLAHPKKSVSPTGVPMVFWSDWHWGEVVDYSQTGGANAYNRTIAAERVERLVRSTLDLCLNHMVRPDYPGVVVCLGGDFLSGSIHDELRETNEGYVAQHFVEVQGVLETALRMMADKFGKVFVPCVVGNHGRTTLKPRAKGRVYESYEWNLYCQLERTFRSDKRFLFHVAGETDAYFSVYGHRFLLTHGDCLGVRGGDGIIGALGPITRGAIKVGRSEAQIGRDFDTLLMGHWHTYIPRGEATPVIVNGSVVGYNEYARLMLRVPYSRPSQALWFVHPKHGITAQWQVYLEPARVPGKGEEWVTFNRRK